MPSALERGTLRKGGREPSANRRQPAGSPSTGITPRLGPLGPALQEASTRRLPPNQPSGARTTSFIRHQTAAAAGRAALANSPKRESSIRRLRTPAPIQTSNLSTKTLRRNEPSPNTHPRGLGVSSPVLTPALYRPISPEELISSMGYDESKVFPAGTPVRNTGHTNLERPERATSRNENSDLAKAKQLYNQWRAERSDQRRVEDASVARTRLTGCKDLDRRSSGGVGTALANNSRTRTPKTAPLPMRSGRSATVDGRPSRSASSKREWLANELGFDPFSWFTDYWRKRAEKKSAKVQQSDTSRISESTASWGHTPAAPPPSPLRPLPIPNVSNVRKIPTPTHSRKYKAGAVEAHRPVQSRYESPSWRTASSTHCRVDSADRKVHLAPPPMLDSSRNCSRDTTITTFGEMMQRANIVSEKPPRQPVSSPLTLVPTSRINSPHSRKSSESKPTKTSSHRSKLSNSIRTPLSFFYANEDNDGGSPMSFQCAGTGDEDLNGDTTQQRAPTKEKIRSPALACMNCGQAAVLNNGLCGYCNGNNQFFAAPPVVSRHRSSASSKARRAAKETVDVPPSKPVKSIPRVDTKNADRSPSKHRDPESLDPNKLTGARISSIYTEGPDLSFVRASTYTDPGNPFTDEPESPPPPLPNDGRMAYFRDLANWESEVEKRTSRPRLEDYINSWRSEVADAKRVSEFGPNAVDAVSLETPVRRSTTTRKQKSPPPPPIPEKSVYRDDGIRDTKFYAFYSPLLAKNENSSGRSPVLGK